MNCKNCGKEIPSEALFCPFCGSAVTAAVEIPAAEPAQPAPEAVVIPAAEPVQPAPDAAGTPAAQPVGQPIPQYQGFGKPIPQYQPYAPKPASGVNGYGIAGFIIALISLWCGVYLCISSIVASVLSLVGVIKMKSFKSCNGLAIAGLIIGLITLVFWGLIWIVVGWGILSGTIPV